jgi:tRNA threonylcarbamoyladenosine biosynthesis protein TsaE
MAEGFLWEHSAGESEIEPIANLLISELKIYPVLFIYGDLGAGKTTLVKYLCKKLGITENMSSPSFGIVNEYRNPDGLIVYHMDLYRLKDISEFESIGGEDYLYSGDLCLIEWPQIIEGFISFDYLKLEISSSQKRRNYKLSIVTNNQFATSDNHRSTD